MELRLKRVVQLAALLGVAGGLVGLRSDGAVLWLLIGATLLWGYWITVKPTRALAICWVPWTAVCCFIYVGITWDFHPLHSVAHTLVGAMLAMPLISAFIGTFTDDVATPPSARVVR